MAEEAPMTREETVKVRKRHTERQFQYWIKRIELGKYFPENLQGYRDSFNTWMVDLHNAYLAG